MQPLFATRSDVFCLVSICAFSIIAPSLPYSVRVCPIFQVSNVTGMNLDLLKIFLNLLPARMPYNEDKPPEFQIDETYSVPVSTKYLLVPLPLPFFFLPCVAFWGDLACYMMCFFHMLLSWPCSKILLAEALICTHACTLCCIYCLY